jgi:hypothetical protein
MEWLIPTAHAKADDEEGGCRHHLRIDNNDGTNGILSRTILGLPLLARSRFLLPFLLSESDTAEECRVSHQDRSQTVVLEELSAVSSMTSTTMIPSPSSAASSSLPPTHIPTMILIKTQTLNFGTSTSNDVPSLEDSNNVSSSTSSNAISTTSFSSWVRPNSHTLSRSVTSTSSDASSTFSSWVRPDSSTLSNAAE